MMAAAAPVLTFDADTHVYRVDGVQVPSVSAILRAAGLVDGYDGIPEHVLRYAADRGTAVHAACCYFDDDDLDPDTLDPIIAPYVAAWMRFREKYPAKILASEQMYFGQLDGLQFGMTLDRVMQFDEQSPTILDIKCTSRIERHHAVQLAGYAIGLASSQAMPKLAPLYRRVVVQLKPDCTYNLHEFSDPEDGEVFAAALKIACWKLR